MTGNCSNCYGSHMYGCAASFRTLGTSRLIFVTRGRTRQRLRRGAAAESVIQTWGWGPGPGAPDRLPVSDRHSF